MNPLELNKSIDATAPIDSADVNDTSLAANLESPPMDDHIEPPLVEEEIEYSTQEVSEEESEEIKAELTEDVSEEANEEVSEEALEEVSETVSEEEIAFSYGDQITESQSDEHVYDYDSMSSAELILRLRTLVHNDVNQTRQEIDLIKQVYYKKHKAQLDEMKHQLSENETPILSAHTDEKDEEFKTLLNEYKGKRAALVLKEESEKESNLLQKRHILEQMELLCKNNEDVSSHLSKFRDLQKKWKTIGQVPAANVNEIWKKYTNLQESFWDLVKISNELREYDFRINYKEKVQICIQAEQLAEDANVVDAFKKLQKLHEDWREIGPVSRDLREEIWDRFKKASAAVNKNHQGYFDDVRKLEDDNLAAKVALCEKIEKLDVTGINSYKAWDEATQQIMQWQEEWRVIGFAPRKVNHKLFERYRAACDAFFSAKATFYKASKNILNENLEKKKALCERAEALMHSEDWKQTSDEMVKLQKEWKTIGPVVKKYSDEIWKRFITACDYFYDQKQKNSSGQKSTEVDNLEKKKALIEKIKALVEPASGSPQQALAALRVMIAEWNEIGFVPFREKDVIYKEYRAAVDKVFECQNVDSNQRRLNSFKSNIRDLSSNGGDTKLVKERERLQRNLDHLKTEIATYENNIGFINSKKNKGNDFFRDTERKIESLKEEARLIEQKLNLIDENL